MYTTINSHRVTAKPLKKPMNEWKSMILCMGAWWTKKIFIVILATTLVNTETYDLCGKLNQQALSTFVWVTFVIKWLVKISKQINTEIKFIPSYILSKSMGEHATCWRVLHLYYICRMGDYFIINSRTFKNGRAEKNIYALRCIKACVSS